MIQLWGISRTGLVVDTVRVDGSSNTDNVESLEREMEVGVRGKDRLALSALRRSCERDRDRQSPSPRRGFLGTCYR